MAPSDPHSPVTPEKAEECPQQVIDATRRMLQKLLQEEVRAQAGEIVVPEAHRQYSIFPHFPQPTADIQKSPLSGFCSHAQSFAAWTLQDMGQKPGCFVFQKLPSPGTEPTGNESTHNHAALTVSIETTAGPKVYLLDPTFRQFCTGGEDSPGALLERQPGGARLAHALQEKGFAEITKADAARYVAAFHGGKNPFSSDDGALKFLTNPDDPRLQHGLWPPKSFLAEKGLYAPPADDYGRSDAAPAAQERLSKPLIKPPGRPGMG